jgi:hypothetical protein
MAYICAFSIVLVLPNVVSSAPLYQNDFETDTTLSWTINKGPATTDEAHNFFSNYSDVGVPPAPHSGALGTRGLKLQANQSSGVFGGMSVSPTGRKIRKRLAVISRRPITHAAKPDATFAIFEHAIDILRR